MTLVLTCHSEITLAPTNSLTHSLVLSTYLSLSVYPSNYLYLRIYMGIILLMYIFQNNLYLSHCLYMGTNRRTIYLHIIIYISVCIWSDPVINLLING